MKKILSILAASALLCAPASFGVFADEDCAVKDILSKFETAYTYSCDVNEKTDGCDILGLVEKICREKIGQAPDIKAELGGCVNIQEFFEKDSIFAQLKAIFEKYEAVPELPEIQPEAPEMPEIQPEEDEQQAPPVQPDLNSQKTMQQQVLDLVNSERAKNGLSPVSYDQAATCAAQKRAVETETLFSHTRPDGSRCFTALDECGASYRGAGENIAMGQMTAREVMDDWMNSDGHRANILNPSFTKLGVGVHKTADGRYCWTQMFIY